MSSEKRDYGRELRRVFDGISDYVEQATDEDLIEDARDAGENPDETATQVRSILLDAVTGFQQRRLREARQSYEEQVAAMRQRTYTLPSTVAERRALLLVLIGKSQEMNRVVTTQFRDLNAITDDDVESLLKQCADLGLLNDLSDSEKDQT